MSGQPTFLDDVYALEEDADSRAFYDRWADSYDRELADNGYVTPDRCAKALIACGADTSAPVLDVGCGTGLSGEALCAHGFTLIDGCDLSEGMLARAKARKGVYRHLFAADLSDDPAIEPGRYTTLMASGVLAAGHIPATAIDALIALLPKGGLFGFSLNDHTLKDPAWMARVMENIDGGGVRLRFSEHGVHLPGIDLMSTVYVLEKS